MKRLDGQPTSTIHIHTHMNVFPEVSGVVVGSLARRMFAKSKSNIATFPCRTLHQHTSGRTTDVLIASGNSVWHTAPHPRPADVRHHLRGLRRQWRRHKLFDGPVHLDFVSHRKLGRQTTARVRRQWCQLCLTDGQVHFDSSLFELLGIKRLHGFVVRRQWGQRC